MEKKKKIINIKKFFFYIILPSILSINLFVLLIFSYIIPYFESNMLESKKEMIKELVNSTISIVNKNYNEFLIGNLNENEAKIDAINKISALRYGIEQKDYFFITDTFPKMIAHPYRTDLVGKDLNNFRDPNGKVLFKEMAQCVISKGHGYVDYKWQWMDDNSKIVPKISYVKGFKPWGWVIGTGIYIEDVRIKTAEIEKELIYVSIIISIIIFMLLIIIIYQNYKSEIKKQIAESELLISKQKYKSLVEASNEGTAMILGGEIVFSNKLFDNFVSPDSMKNTITDLENIIHFDIKNDKTKIDVFFESDLIDYQIQTRIKNKDNFFINVLLSISKISLDGKIGFIVIIKKLLTETVMISEKINWEGVWFDLMESFNFATIKLNPNQKLSIIDLNTNALQLLKYNTKNDILNKSFADLIENEEYLNFILLKIQNKQSIEKYPMIIIDNNNTPVNIKLFGKLINEDNQEMFVAFFYDYGKELEKQNLIDTEIIHSSLLKNFLNTELHNFQHSISKAYLNQSLFNAVVLMKQNSTDTILICSENDIEIGIVTDSDIRKCIIENKSFDYGNLNEIMSAPIISLKDNSTIKDAISVMKRNNIKHIVLKDSSEKICGVVGLDDILKNISNIVDLLQNEVLNASTILDLKKIYARLQHNTRYLLESGMKPRFIVQQISSLADSIINKLIDFIIEEIGAPPTDFAFVSLGSLGRNELTLSTDQDNAIIFNDININQESISNYFLKFAEKLNFYLDSIGYDYCKGDIMAKNIKWNQPLSVWKKYFKDWIVNPNPQNLMEIAIFFDMKLNYGDKVLFDELKIYIFKLLQENQAFYGFLAREVFNYKTQINFFKKIQTEYINEHPKSINLKNALRLIVSLVRIYSMKINLNDINTIDRLIQIYHHRLISKELYLDILYSYEYLTLLQFKSQIKSIEVDSKFYNYLDLDMIPEIEVEHLKNILAKISVFQSKLKFDFSIGE